jgi:hypothetical protein
MIAFAPTLGREAPSERGPEMTVSARSAWDCDFVINGRFLAQPVTGVQRQAREITGSIDRMLSRSKGRVRLLGPTKATSVPDYKSIDVTQLGFAMGYLWEQSELLLRVDKQILSLCNSGPAYSANQVVCIHDVNVFREADSYSFALMALGCPAVSSDRGSMQEICRDAALLASPDDPAAWHAHFAALVGAKSLRTELRERGFQRAKRFSWAESSQAYLQLYGH